MSLEDGSELREAVAIMARLRGPGGCPWDREQTFDSIKKHTLEEVYEVFDAIERRDFAGLKDELGDLLLQVLFYAQMAADEGMFTIADVAANLNAKLVRRHPHIFGDATATDSDAVLRNWEQVKREEKGAGSAGASLLDDVPRTMPATLEAHKLGSRASKVGFDWPDASGLFAKLDEEIAELMVEVEAKHSANVEAEFGDLMFTVMNLARHLKVDAESALRRSNAKVSRALLARWRLRQVGRLKVKMWRSWKSSGWVRRRGKSFERKGREGSTRRTRRELARDSNHRVA